MPLQCLLCWAQHNCHLLNRPHKLWGPLQDHPASPSGLWLCLQDTHGLCRGLLSQHLAWAREVLRTIVSQTTCLSQLPSLERWQMLGVSAPHFSPPGHLVPKSGFPKSQLQRKQGAALRNFKGTSNFSSMRSCKIPSPQRGASGGTKEAAYHCWAQTCFSAKPAGTVGGKVQIPGVLRRSRGPLTSFSLISKNCQMGMSDSILLDYGEE